MSQPKPTNLSGFNTQPPEGGWVILCILSGNIFSFNTQPPEGGWGLTLTTPPKKRRFQHTAA